MIVPDSITPVEGWKTLSLIGFPALKTGQVKAYLSSPLREATWEPRTRLEALCLANGDHIAPSNGCWCGIHIAATIGPAMQAHMHAQVIAKVKGWGLTTPCDHGWRCQYAYPSEIYLVNYGVYDLSDYGVPVYPLEECEAYEEWVKNGKMLQLQSAPLWTMSTTLIPAQSGTTFVSFVQSGGLAASQMKQMATTMKQVQLSATMTAAAIATQAPSIPPPLPLPSPKFSARWVLLALANIALCVLNIFLFFEQSDIFAVFSLLAACASAFAAFSCFMRILSSS